MTKSKDRDGLIASEDLSLENVPSPESDRETLETFCLTIDGYERGRYSIEDLLRVAERVEREGLKKASLDELRVAAFIRQRELRWTSHGDDVPSTFEKLLVPRGVDPDGLGPLSDEDRRLRIEFEKAHGGSLSSLG